MKTSPPTTKWEALQQQVLGWVVWPALGLARLVMAAGYALGLSLS